jgi:hypothetical protein
VKFGGGEDEMITRVEVENDVSAYSEKAHDCGGEGDGY